MASASFRRKTVLLLLLAVLAAPWASAASRPAAQLGPAGSSAPAPLDLFSSAWRFLTHLWSEEGCRIDPSGACMPQSAQPLTAPRTNEGCRIDPNGACLPRPALSAPETDTGCRIDPDGLCRF
ncbi:MAG TPA: hypothetical protein VF173_19810 [Thermoanaerobaculia bacterium]|nr:hypothetical protein [Thermoanaerobaculia bacterium]